MKKSKGTDTLAHVHDAICQDRKAWRAPILRFGTGSAGDQMAPEQLLSEQLEDTTPQLLRCQQKHSSHHGDGSRTCPLVLVYRSGWNILRSDDQIRGLAPCADTKLKWGAPAALAARAVASTYSRSTFRNASALPAVCSTVKGNCAQIMLPAIVRTACGLAWLLQESHTKA